MTALPPCVHPKRLCVYIQHVPVCTCTTSTCMKHVDEVPVHTGTRHDTTHNTATPPSPTTQTHTYHTTHHTHALMVTSSEHEKHGGSNWKKPQSNHEKTVTVVFLWFDRGFLWFDRGFFCGLVKPQTPRQKPQSNHQKPRSCLVFLAVTGSRKASY